jgi:hypothetical protein
MHKILPATAIAALLAVLLSTPAIASSTTVGVDDGISSENHAGYAVAAHGPLHEVVARWVQPTPTCGSQPTYANVQAELAKKTHIFKVGTASNCRGGNPVAYAWFYSSADQRQRLPRTVLPGDVMRVKVSWYHREVEYSISNLTRHWGLGVGMFDGYSRVATRATFGLAARSGTTGALPLTDIGTVHFLACWVQGQKITDADATAVTMSHGRVVKAEPGPIDPPGAFSVTWHHI